MFTGSKTMIKNSKKFVNSQKVNELKNCSLIQKSSQIQKIYHANTKKCSRIKFWNHKQVSTSQTILNVKKWNSWRFFETTNKKIKNMKKNSFFNLLNIFWKHEQSLKNPNNFLKRGIFWKTQYFLKLWTKFENTNGFWIFWAFFENTNKI